VSGLVVVSPHCDDAVFSCGDLLAERRGARVVTCFAGPPPRQAPLTPWDAAAGFRPGDDVMARRRAEDAAALALLGARPAWLDFRDSQYGRSPSAGTLADALAAALGEGPATVLAPLGLFHSDHRLAHEAALLVRARRRDLAWTFYEDALYRRLPALLDERLAALRARGLALRRAPRPARRASPLKLAAIAKYRSQIRALRTPGRPGVRDALAPEGYWQVAA
jgi:LmbE family N-acetylglucosaminyl deacetylase